ncbi:hypothetical protein [Actinoplanes sp. NPDC026670]|uniref:hypothetical protein n=1 Tax=Actinoplanes sp. NPDC026670 TaxID=3154700 RepID=UPI0033E1F245
MLTSITRLAVRVSVAAGASRLVCSSIELITCTTAADLYRRPAEPDHDLVGTISLIRIALVAGL